MKFNKESVGYVVVFTFIVCMAFVVILSAANTMTLSQVEANRKFAAQFAVLKAFGLADTATPRAEVESRYAASVKELAAPAPELAAKGAIAAFRADIDGAPYVAVRVTGSGLWGSITTVIAADPQATRMRGIEILDQQETPGLGGRIGEPWFAAQFAGEAVGPDGTVKVDQNGTGKGDADKENGRADAITGASRTSDFVAAIVANGLAAVKSIGGTL
jgi:Na+-transporting NADH:ubiquinone oxidoreductase subunit C